MTWKMEDVGMDDKGGSVIRGHVGMVDTVDTGDGPGSIGPVSIEV
jgi:hypothetical protein